jgi:hypothetical protein
VGRHQGKIAREGKQESRIETSCGEEADLFGSRCNELQSGVGAKNTGRMRFESNSHGLATLSLGAVHDVRQDPAVGAVNAVEVADTDQSRSKAGGNVLEFMKN